MLQVIIIHNIEIFKPVEIKNNNFEINNNFYGSVNLDTNNNINGNYYLYSN